MRRKKKERKKEGYGLETSRIIKNLYIICMKLEFNFILDKI